MSKKLLKLETKFLITVTWSFWVSKPRTQASWLEHLFVSSFKSKNAEQDLLILPVDKNHFSAKLPSGFSYQWLSRQISTCKKVFNFTNFDFGLCIGILIGQKVPLNIFDFQPRLSPKVLACFLPSATQSSVFYFWRRTHHKKCQVWLLHLNSDTPNKPKVPFVMTILDFRAQVPQTSSLVSSNVLINSFQLLGEHLTLNCGILFIALEFSSKMPEKSISNDFSRFPNSLSSNSACLISSFKAWKKI